ncbi:MAG: hypothetical protein K6F68_05475 [Clostridiales bacterium]|nr:hypothetical protein [Clostridiales bacterium]
MRIKVFLLSVSHAAVDLACAALFFGLLQGEGVWLNMVLYNAFAFLMQLPMGILADRLDRNLPFAALGCGLVAIAFMLVSCPWLAAVIAGIGNGAFHVGGGIEVLNSSDGKAGPLGVFVSPGAIGLYLGAFYARFLAEHRFIMPAAVLFLGVVILLYSRRNEEKLTHNAEFSAELPQAGLLPLAALFAVVVLRSFIGTSDAFSPGDALSALPPVLAGLIPVLLLALGKAAGGFVSDAIGPRLTGIISLSLLAAALFFPVSPYLALCALFLFNMTMPITLHASAKLLSRARGTAFGLLTAALFIGCVPAFLGFRMSAPAYVNGLFALASLGLLLLGLKKVRA